MVAPYMGAWIEISTGVSLRRMVNIVAPYMGAWIEIRLNLARYCML